MTGPAVGDVAPEVDLRDQHGRRVTLTSYRGKKAVVLVFYPAAFSPVCSNELYTLRERWPALGRDDAVLLAVSCDPMFALRTFADQEGIDFPLLSDFWPHGAVSAAYGVFDTEFGSSKRSTFVIDNEGRIRWLVHNAMPDARSVDDYAAALERIRAI